VAGRVRLLSHPHQHWHAGALHRTTCMLAPPSLSCGPRMCSAGGQVLSAVVGVCVRLAFNGAAPVVCNALGMALALLLMQLTCTTHPPGA
jgi:CBS-domain-containing membrane protein